MGYELQYAAAVNDISPGWGDMIKSGGDLLASLYQIGTQVQLSEIERERLNAQINAAKAGRPPVVFAQPLRDSGLIFGLTSQQLIAGGLLLGAFAFIYSHSKRR